MHVSSKVGTVCPYVHRIEVFEHMNLLECPSLQEGLYGSLRQQVDKELHGDVSVSEELIKEYMTRYPKIRKVDLRWWFRIFFLRKAEEEDKKRGKFLQFQVKSIKAISLDETVIVYLAKKWSGASSEIEYSDPFWRRKGASELFQWKSARTKETPKGSNSDFYTRAIS